MMVPRTRLLSTLALQLRRTFAACCWWDLGYRWYDKAYLNPMPQYLESLFFMKSINLRCDRLSGAKGIDFHLIHVCPS